MDVLHPFHCPATHSVGEVTLSQGESFWSLLLQGFNGNFPVRNAVIDTFLTTAALEYELSQGYYHLPNHVGLKEILLSTKKKDSGNFRGEKMQEVMEKMTSLHHWHPP